MQFYKVTFSEFFEVFLDLWLLLKKKNYIEIKKLFFKGVLANTINTQFIFSAAPDSLQKTNSDWSFRQADKGSRYQMNVRTLNVDWIFKIQVLQV